MAEQTEPVVLLETSKEGLFFRIKLDEMDVRTVNIELLRAEAHLLRLAVLELNSRAVALEKRVAKLITPKIKINLDKLLKQRRPDLRRA